MADLIATMQAAAGAGGGGVVEPVGIDFDGTNDYLIRSSDLVGSTDSKTFTLSCWVYNGDTGATEFAVSVGINRLQLSVKDARVQVLARNSSATIILNTETPIGSNPVDTWINILVSCDMANVANRSIYISDTLQSPTFATYTNDNINFSITGASSIGASTIAGQKVKGRLAGVYLDYTYRDLSVEANRRDFIDENGLYVTPPTSGIISVPMDDPADPGRNDGTGGDFTLNGVVAQSGRGPNQYNAAASTFDGSADYLSRSSTLTGLTEEATTTVSFWLKPHTLPAGDRIIIGFNNGNQYTHEGQLKWRTNGTVAFDFSKSGSGTLAAGQTSSALALNTWHHVALSFDAGSGDKKLYVNGVEDTTATFVLNSGNVAYNSVDRLALMSNTFGFVDGDLADVWFDTTYIDLSSNNPFYDTDTGKPKYLGASGELPTGSAPLIYLPLRADDAGNNLGTGGDFTVNSGPYTGARGPSEFWGESAEFNGSNQSLVISGGLTGATSSKTLTLVCAIKKDAIGSTKYVIHSANDRYALLVQSTNNFKLLGKNSSNVTVADIRSSSTISAGSWVTYMISFDLADGGSPNLYINGSADSPTYTTYVNDSIDIGTTSDSEISYSASASPSFDGNIGFMYFSDEYIDFSQEANRLKFFDAFGYPVDLGEDGSLPTGNQPLIYLNEGFHLGTNLGSGGNFTPQNTPTDGGYVKG